MVKVLAYAAGLALALPVSPIAAEVETDPVTTETFLIPSADPAIKIYLRNRHLSNREKFAGDRIVLFVHGATYPAETAFDLDLPGGSWMEYAARRGYDAWLVDVRGYGGSTRPPAMDAPPDKNPPFANTAEAVQDVGSAVNFILKRRAASKLDLVGWSWGTAIVATYTSEHNERVNKLVLYAPVWFRKGASPVSGIGAYRSVQKEGARQRRLSGIPEGRQEEISPLASFEKWWAANLATDPVGAAQTPPVLRAPNGVIQDAMDYWRVGKSTYDPSKIKVPVLVIVAEWDQDTPLYMAQELFPRFVNTPWKRHVVLGEGTHSICLEKNRMQLIQQVQSFLDET